MESPNSTSLFSLTIDPVTKTHLTETARWARFLAIFGMVILGLALVGSFLLPMMSMRMFGFQTGIDEGSNASLSALRVGLVVGTVIMFAIVFFPLLFLLRFANGMHHAIAANDQSRLNESFQNLKVYFRYLGILVIIFLVLYGLIIAIAVLGIATNR